MDTIIKPRQARLRRQEISVLVDTCCMSPEEAAIELQTATIGLVPGEGSLDDLDALLPSFDAAERRINQGYKVIEI